MTQSSTNVGAELLDVTKVCATFPPLTGIQIPRDNLHHSLETIFEGDVQLLGVEGPEGIGKTTLLAQFARRHLDRCISMFVRPTSRLAYDPAILRADLCNQMSWIVSKKEVQAPQAGDKGLYRHLIMELQRRARRPEQRFFFLVDGLEALPQDAADVLALLELLPLGLPQFKFLFSGSSEQLKALAKTRLVYKSMHIPGFTLDETTRFFLDVHVSADLVSEVFKTCKGVPANLAALKRIIHSGVPADSLLEHLPESLVASFEIEWKAVDEGNLLQVEVLTLLAYDRRKLTLDHIARIFGSEPGSVRAALGPLGFVSTPASEFAEVSFISEAFRKFAGLRLSGHRERVRSLVIDQMLREPSSDDALAYLPNFFQESGRLIELIEFLSPEHFAAMIESSQSLAPVQLKASLGVKAAIQLNRDDDLLRFGLQEAVITELDGCQISRSEVKARMALDDYESSLALAQTAVLKQDRLRLMALIARLQREKGLTPEPVLLEQLSQLYTQADPAALRENIDELASDLMFSRPELAIQLIERAPASAREPASLDWALARLSVEFLAQRRKLASPVPPAVDVRSRIKDPAALTFSTAIALFLGDYTPSEVLREVEKLESPTDQLFLLKEWAENTQEPESAGEILLYALRLAIRSTEYTPHATNLRKLATPLPFLPDVELRRSLIGTFDTQKATIEKLGPTEDYVRLQLLLTQAEAVHDIDSANSRLLETYYYIAGIKDLEVRTSCTARLLSALPEIDPSAKFVMAKDMSDAERELKDLVAELLSATADHYLVSRNVIEALSKNRAELAFEVARSLNAEWRRDQAQLDVFSHVMKQPAVKIPFTILEYCLDEFIESDNRGYAIESVLQRVSQYGEKTVTKVIGQIVPFIGKIARIDDLGVRSQASCSALKILSKLPDQTYAGLAKRVEDDLNATWNKMEPGSEKIEVGFSIASSLAPHSRDRAMEYLATADTLRRNSALNYNVQSSMSCIRLAVRAYAGLLPKHFDTDSDLDALISQIERIVSDYGRISVWTDLALRYFQHGRFAEGRRLVADRIKGNLDAVDRRSSEEWKSAVVLAAPALYQNHKTSALEMFLRLDVASRDDAYSRILTFTFRRRPPSEPYDGGGSGAAADLSYEDALDVVELLDKMDADADIYAWIEHLVESITWKHKLKSFSQQQRVDIGQRLTVVANAKFPNPRYIKHLGFLILAKAQVATLCKQRPFPWEEFVLAAKKIPNLSDSVYTLAVLANSCVDVDINLRAAALRDAKEMANRIPSLIDRVDRLEVLANEARDVDISISKHCIREIISSSSRIDGREADSIRRRVVDFAHAIDPELASSLVDSLDDDEARKEARERIELQKMKKRVAEGTDDSVPEGGDAARMASCMWELLGKLNAGRIEPTGVGNSRRYVELASRMALDEAYPILAWVVENAIRRRGHADESRKLLRGFYDAALIGCELAYRLGGRAANRIGEVVDQASAASEKASMVVHSGERQAALEFLREWLSRNVSEFLKICDPYFGPDDLDALILVLGAAPKTVVSILTSKKHQEGQCADWGVEESYLRQWRRLSDQAPPVNEIVIVGTASGDLPIHDRWWLTRSAGLRMGTSFNSLGGKRETEISVLTEVEARQREKEIDEYLSFRKREHRGERLSIHTFAIPFKS